MAGERAESCGTFSHPGAEVIAVDSCSGEIREGEERGGGGKGGMRGRIVGVGEGV